MKEENSPAMSYWKGGRKAGYPPFDRVRRAKKRRKRGHVEQLTLGLKKEGSQSNDVTKRKEY